MLPAQEHASPPHRGLGIPGPQARSFLISWHPVPGVVAYEYILTDNFLCFAGCAGDTREKMVVDTFALEYELLIDKQYYWRTRAHFENGETGPWSLISEFWAYTPPLSPLVQVRPNPTQGPLSLNLDWGANVQVDYLRVEVLDMSGRSVTGPREIRPTTPFVRSEPLILEALTLVPGVYLLRVQAESNDGRSFQPYVTKFLVQE